MILMMHDLIPDDYVKDERCPTILLTKEEKKKMRKPWRNSLIINMFDGKLGYMGLMRRLKRKWSIKGEMALTDSYLMIRKWAPNFIPNEIQKGSYCLGKETYPIDWYFDMKFLSKIGPKIGKVLHIDKTAAQEEMGQLLALVFKF